MKIVVIGGTGLIGSQVVTGLRAKGHEAVAAAPSSGVNTLTGEGLAEALAGAQVVVDVANSPSFEDAAALAFFETSGRNLLAAEKTAGVSHHIALSVVGTDRLQAMGYFRAKLLQEKLIVAAGTPYTIVHATQFFEFMGGIAQAGTTSDAVRLSTAALQPIASADVAAALVDVALASPVNGMVEVAGPDRRPLVDFVGAWLVAMGDGRRVEADPTATYFGIAIDDASLTPGPDARIMSSRFDDWLAQSRAKAEAGA